MLKIDRTAIALDFSRGMSRHQSGKPARFGSIRLKTQAQIDVTRAKILRGFNLPRLNSRSACLEDQLGSAELVCSLARRDTDISVSLLNFHKIANNDLKLPSSVFPWGIFCKPKNKKNRFSHPSLN